MIRFFKNKCKVFTFLVLLMFFALPNYAQKQDVFEDSLGVKGVVIYATENFDTKLPKQGPYSIQWREFENNKVITYLVNGEVRNHLPHGNWVWQQGNWNYNINAAKTIQPNFSTSGTVSKWQGSFDNGLPNKNWTFSLDSVDNNGKIVENLVQVRVAYKNGIPTGKFSIEDKRTNSSFNLLGNTDANGIATGEWIYNYKFNNNTITEKHNYINGLLQNVIIFANDTQQINYTSNQHFFSHTDTQNIVTKIGALSFFESEHLGNANNFWTELTQNYYQNGWQLGVVPHDFHLPIAAFKRLEYPLTTEELAQIENIQIVSSSIQNKINEYIKGEMLIQRSRSSAMDLSISFLEQTSKRMHLIDSLILRTKLPSFTYKNRFQQGVLHYIDAINSMAEIKAQVYDTLSVFLPTISPNTQNFKLFKELEMLVEISEKSLEEHFAIIATETVNIQHENDRKELENELLLKLKNLQEKFDNQYGVGAQIEEKWISGHLQSEIKRYAQKDDYETAMNLGNKILQRIDTITLLHNRVAVFDSMPQRIFDEYNRMVFNPFTGKNDLPLTVKKRFLTTILDNLWPWLEQNIQNETDWESWKQLWEQQFSLYNFVMTFANREDKQAQKLNKKARKETNPEKLLKMLQ